MQIEKFAGVIGATVTGVDLSRPLAPADVDAIRAAWLEHMVLFFPGQDLSPQNHVDFAHHFAESLERLPFMATLEGYDDIQVAGTNPDYKPELFIDWHTDVTWQEVPTLGTVLHCLETPAGTGATLWLNLCAAFDDLSGPMQRMLAGLTGVHDPLNGREASMIASMGAKNFAATREKMPLVEHPLVVEHPETGRPVLYVNPVFLHHIKELTAGESAALLGYLYRHCERPEYQCRLQWQPGTLAFWDNRCTMHKVVNDFWPARRLMHRIGLNCTARPVAAVLS